MHIFQGMKAFEVLVVTVLVGIASALSADPVEPQTVSSVDLSRYAGKWYEIARYPNGFQRKCASSVTATYTLRNDGKVEVLNNCKQADGKMKSAKGTAKVVDKTTNSKLKVSFFWPFYGDYWILDLDPDYQYAVVGEKKRKYLWILSRTPQMNPEMYSQILERLHNQGYDTNKLVLTKTS